MRAYSFEAWVGKDGGSEKEEEATYPKAFEEVES